MIQCLAHIYISYRLHWLKKSNVAQYTELRQSTVHDNINNKLIYLPVQSSLSKRNSLRFSLLCVLSIAAAAINSTMYG